MDREKVIKALECCLKESDHLYSNPCKDCPYEGKECTDWMKKECIDRMKADALAVLEEQEEKMKHLNNIALEYEKEVFRLQTLLKEQEGIVPYIDIDEAKCPVCKVKLTRQELIGDDVLFEDFFDYCPHCGKPVLWEGR